MKKITKMFFLILVLCIALPGLIYLGLAIYYQDSFLYGTWINGVYCTGKTVEQVNKELTEKYQYEGLNILAAEGEYFLPAEAVDYQFDFIPALEEFQKEQNPYRWLKRMLYHPRELFIAPIGSYNQEKLEAWLEEAPFYKKRKEQTDFKVEIVHTEQGYELQDGKKHILLLDAMDSVLGGALLENLPSVDLEGYGCYGNLKDTKAEAALRKLYEQVSAFQNRSLTYVIKDKTKTLTPYELSLFIATDGEGKILTDKEGNFQADTKAIEAFVRKLAKEYNTWNHYEFTTHDGREKLFTNGNLGIKINEKAEQKYLLSWINNPVENTRTPVYLKDVCFGESGGIGDTYIEVDMGAQRMFYFKEGEQLLETDVVTGKHKATPEKVCYVYSKQTNRTLRGPGYAAFVNFWVPVYGNIGIHDAPWRSRFGGDIYIKSGSHGCINTPYDAMKELFEQMELKTPVVLYYE